MTEIRQVAPGQPVVLNLDYGAQGEGLTVRITTRTVTAARETPFQKFIYTPSLWASSIAGIAVFLLLGTAAATGTIRPAPPSAPTPAPGEPTPTPDSRPVISIGGFQLVAPAPPPATATPARLTITVSRAQTDNAEQSLNLSDQAGDDQSPADPTTVQRPPPAQPCTNLFGIGCRSSPPPPPPRLRVVPGPSPEPGADSPEPALGLGRSGPAPGSNLDDALRAASIVDQQFNKRLSTDAAAASGH